MRYKKTLIFAFIFFFIFVFGVYLISKDVDNSFAKSIKDKVPVKIKLFLKNTLFYIPYSKRELKKLSKKIQELNEENRKLTLEKHKLENIINSGKLKLENYNFTKYNYHSIILPFYSEDNIFANKKPAYIEIYKDFIIIMFGSGKVIFLDKKDFYNGTLNYSIINSSLNKKLLFNQEVKWTGVKDVLVIDNKLYISLTQEIKKDCYNTSLYNTDINLNYLKFEKVYRSDECYYLNKEIKNFRYFNGYQTGGRIVNVDNDIYLTIGDYNNWETVQNINSSSGKILSFNTISQNLKFISMGHRNAQGLYYIEDHNSLISTEHGPKGGDEINIINLNNANILNYGWPISSYGDHYDVVPLNTYTKKYAPLNKSHKNFGFVEPIKYFKQSVGISEIIKNYYKKNSFFVTSLKSQTIFEINLDDNLNFLEIKDEIKIGERIRDIIYDKDNNCYLLYGETTAKLISMCSN